MGKGFGRECMLTSMDFLNEGGASNIEFHSWCVWVYKSVCVCEREIDGGVQFDRNILHPTQNISLQSFSITGASSQVDLCVCLCVSECMCWHSCWEQYGFLLVISTECILNDCMGTAVCVCECVCV